MKPLNRIPILCTASILYLFIIGRNLSTKQTLAAACHAGRGECGQVPPWNAIWNATRIAPWHPFSGFCWRYACLPVLTLGIQCPGDAVTTMLPAGIRLGRESASLVRAVKDRPQGNPTPGRWRALSLSAMELRSNGSKKGQIYLPIAQRVCYYAAVGLPMLWLPLKHCTDSAPAPPGAPGLSWGYWDWKGNTVSDGHYEDPCSPQIFRSSLVAFPVRSWLIPIGGALCRFYALCGGVAG